MKTWEKIQKLDQEYLEARKKILLGTIESVAVTMVEKTKQPTKQIKNASKSSTENHSTQ
jgi:hypothetical protein